jgi:hypothetical protein
MDLGRLPDEKLAEITETAKRGLSLFFEAGVRKWSKYQFSVFWLYRINASRIYDRDYYELDFDDPRITETVQAWQNKGYLELIGRDDLYVEMLKPFGVYESEATNDEVVEVLDIAKAGLTRFYYETGGKWQRFEFVTLFIGSAHDYKVSFSDPRIQEAIRSWIDDGFIKYIGEEDLFIEVIEPFPPVSRM